MNKAITDGVQLMPPAFEAGLDQWSSGNGTPGSDTYENALNAAVVPGDQDFGTCLELQKVETVQKLRFMGETPLLPGCYLQVRARIKAVSGNLPAVRIAGWAGAGGNAHVPGVDETGPVTALTSYGDVVEVTAIVGAGARSGVDMVWGSNAIYGHFGLDLTGATGGVVRIESIEIEDVTNVFLRDMLNFVDVRDFGAVGNGTTDDSAAFEAADAAANGRKVLVSKGTYRLNESVTLQSRVEFEGTVTMPANRILSLTKNYDLPSYIDAFGDEELAFKKAFQALLNNADHESLDMGGRRINITEPIDMRAAVANKNEYAQRRHVRNGQFYVVGDSAWNSDVVTSIATYSPNNARTLKNVVNVANIKVGSLVSGNGVGREIYVHSKNVANQEITLTQPLHDAAGTQNFTFTRFKYVLDFSGFEKLSKFSMSDIEIQCNNKASGILLAPEGLIFHLKDSFITRPKNRAITSHGEGCQGMLIDRCQFLTAEGNTRAQDRQSIVLNTNANDVKLRNNRASQFRHFAVMGGANGTIIGNHFFQGDTETNGIRTGGIILASAHCSTTITGNYIDNCSVEWSNEYDASPGFTSGYSFSGLSITNNVFISGDVAPWFAYVVIKPFGGGHFIGGLTMTGNKFRSINGNIDRVDRVDTSYAGLDMSKGKNIFVDGNTFHAIDTPVANPLLVKYTKNSTGNTWTVDSGARFPFGGQARSVEALVMTGPIRNSSNGMEYAMPYVSTRQGSDKDQIKLHWHKAVKGSVAVTMRMD